MLVGIIVLGILLIYIGYRADMKNNPHKFENGKLKEEYTHKAKKQKEEESTQNKQLINGTRSTFDSDVDIYITNQKKLLGSGASNSSLQTRLLAIQVIQNQQMLDNQKEIISLLKYQIRDSL